MYAAARRCRVQKESRGTGGQAEGVYTTIDENTAGTVSGTIHFAGQAPKRVEIDMAQDPVCSVADANSSEQYMVHDGTLQNVFIYVKDGLGNKLYAPSADPVVIDQKGCRFTPHVVGVMAGQPVKFTNSDPTMHNVHMTPQISTNQIGRYFSASERIGRDAHAAHAGVDGAGALQQSSVDGRFHQCGRKSVLCCLGSGGALHDQRIAARNLHNCRRP